MPLCLPTTVLLLQTLIVCYNMQALIGSTRSLLCDLGHYYGLTDGQAGRTLSRRMHNLLKVKKGICSAGIDQNILLVVQKEPLDSAAR